MDWLFWKVFKNKYLFGYIFSLVPSCDNIGWHGGEYSKKRFKKLDEIDLPIIFENQKLFQLKYQSYLYNKNNGSGDGANNGSIVFNQIQRYAKEFFQSPIINIQVFASIYSDFKDEFSRYSRMKLLQFCMLNQDHQLCKDQILYLMEHQSLKFDIHQYDLFIKLCWGRIKSKLKANQLGGASDGELDLFYFIINCFKNHTFNNLYYGRNKTQQLIKPLRATVPFKYVLESIKLNLQDMHQVLLERCQLLDENGNDIQAFKHRTLISRRSLLIQYIIVYGSKSFAKVYCDQFPNQAYTNLRFTRNLIDPSTNLQDSIDAANILSANNTLPKQTWHSRYFHNYNQIKSN